MNLAFLWAFMGTLFTFSMTSIGAAMVFAMRKELGGYLQKISLGFAAGVMLAATVWSLLLPAIEDTQERGGIAWLPAALGFVAGGGFLMLVDLWMPNLSVIAQIGEKRTALPVLAVTLHNIPEGMAVGLSFALAAASPDRPELYATALAFALGIGIQNFPEGAAISLPLRQEGMSRLRAFFFGSMSGLVEVVFGVGIVFIARLIMPYMPWLLAFAAGAMVYVVVEELIPQAGWCTEEIEQTGGGLKRQSAMRSGTIGLFIGFVIMMILDVALG